MDEKEQNTQENNITPTPKKGKSAARIIKKSVLITVAALTGLSVGAVVAAKEGYDLMFGRYDRPDYSITPGVCCIERADKSVTREEISFKSGKVRLQGYHYPCPNPTGLVVICHGIHAGADDYLPIAEYMVKHGFSVFSFDYKGTYSSDGDGTVGMCESLVDLDHALNYIEGAPEFKDMPVFLIGHSWGGYAAASVLSLHSSVSACACISAPNSGYTLILEKGEQYAGKLGSKGVPQVFFNTYHKILFGKYVNYDGVKGINSTKIPVLLAHGKNDEVIDYQRQAIVSRRNDLREEGITYYFTEGAQGGHDSIWHSARAIEYQNEVNARLKELKKVNSTYQAKVNYVASVNHSLYSEVNEELFEKICKVFKDSAK